MTINIKPPVGSARPITSGERTQLVLDLELDGVKSDPTSCCRPLEKRFDAVLILSDRAFFDAALGEIPGRHDADDATADHHDIGGFRRGCCETQRHSCPERKHDR